MYLESFLWINNTYSSMIGASFGTIYGCPSSFSGSVTFIDSGPVLFNLIFEDETPLYSSAKIHAVAPQKKLPRAFDAGYLQQRLADRVIMETDS